MDVRNVYRWEIETEDGTIYEVGNDYDPNRVVRLSFIPIHNIFPRHDIIFQDFKLVKRFCRAFMGMSHGMQEYLHCVETDKFRLYLKSSNGQVIITPREYELYL